MNFPLLAGSFLNANFWASATVSNAKPARKMSPPTATRTGFVATTADVPALPADATKACVAVTGRTHTKAHIPCKNQNPASLNGYLLGPVNKGSPGFEKKGDSRSSVSVYKTLLNKNPPSLSAQAVTDIVMSSEGLIANIGVAVALHMIRWVAQADRGKDMVPVRSVILCDLVMAVMANPMALAPAMTLMEVKRRVPSVGDAAAAATVEREAAALREVDVEAKLVGCGEGGKKRQEDEG